MQRSFQEALLKALEKGAPENARAAKGDGRSASSPQRKAKQRDEKLKVVVPPKQPVDADFAAAVADVIPMRVAQVVPLGLPSRTPLARAAFLTSQDEMGPQRIRDLLKDKKFGGSVDFLGSTPPGPASKKQRAAGPSAKRKAAEPGWVTPRYPHLREPTFIPGTVADAVTLSIGPAAELLWQPKRDGAAALLVHSTSEGLQTQIHAEDFATTREVVMGLDFGTSSVKVVISDRGLKQSFAVPFRDAVGVDSYLLPSRLFESEHGYSLEAGSKTAAVHGNLKLSLLDKPHDADARMRVVGFLALAIRRVRAWLFDCHRDAYVRTEIVWTLVLGHPTDHATEAELRPLYEGLGRAAWLIAGSSSPVTAAACKHALAETFRNLSTADESLDVLPMPEVAAQVYGFVTSNHFDPKGQNIFLLADVGAGTVDSCLFRVYPEKSGGQWSIEIYTSAVKPNGVMNFHRYRVDWWESQLRMQDGQERICAMLERIKLATEHQTSIPDSFDGYLRGVTVTFAGEARDPDEQFFRGRVLPQVQGQTLYQAFKSDVLPKEALKAVPFFLCGGGARLGFYRQLGGPLQNYKVLTG